MSGELGVACDQNPPSDNDRFIQRGTNWVTRLELKILVYNFSLTLPKTATLTKEVEVDLLHADWNSYLRSAVIYAMI